MKSEHIPLMDAMLDHLAQEPRLGERPLTGLERWLITDLREARRLLRVVEECPMCGESDKEFRHTAACEFGRYLADCEGKGEGG